MTVSDEKYTVDQVAKHNCPGDAWCIVHDGVYDVSNFANAHPGGDIILLGAGKDATILFETYHPKAVPDAVLRKYRIGTVRHKNDEKVSVDSYYSWESDFYPVMKARVVEKLREVGQERRGGKELWIKAVLLLTGFWSSLYAMCMLDPNGLGILAACTLGVFAAFVGTCIQHDGSHGAFAKTRFINKIAGWTLDMIGASAMTWEIQHVLGHHPYTNLLGHVVAGQGKHDQESDPDVFSTYPMLRLHPTHTRRWYHRFQHFYAPLLFGFMTISKVIFQDFKVFLSRRLFQIDANCRYASAGYRLRFVAMKLMTILYMIALPCYMHGIPQGLKLIFIAHFVCGEFLATMFIVNHIIEGVAYISKTDKNGSTPRTIRGVTPMKSTISSAKEGKTVPLNDWAAVQCQTSVNWATGSWFWNHFSGGLNHQVEHHLFPSLAHENYYHIQPVVQQTCEEYGVPYQGEASLWTAYWKMLGHLKVLGNTPLESWD